MSKSLPVFAMLIFAANLWAGPCQCPSDHKKNGSRCGEGSAFCQPGGEEPMCGAKSDAQRADLFKKLCPKKFAKIQKLLNKPK